MQALPDSYHTLAGPATGAFKDRGSKFLGYAWPVREEAEALAHLESLRREHFKARHHCYAWRFGVDGTRFRANDDGEPSGTAGRPILGQIDAFGLTDVVVVVVRYFGGTLLGTSGLIHAYRETAAETLSAATIIEKIITDKIRLDFEYALMPEIMHALKKLNLDLLDQQFDDHGRIDIGIRKKETPQTLLQLKALLHKVSTEEAISLDWPDGLRLTNL